MERKSEREEREEKREEREEREKEQDHVMAAYTHTRSVSHNFFFSSRTSPFSTPASLAYLQHDKELATGDVIQAQV